MGNYSKGDLDETDFAALSNTDGYSDSKIHEETILQEFKDSQKGQQDRTEVVILNIGLVTGPPILSTPFNSMNIIGGVL